MGEDSAPDRFPGGRFLGGRQARHLVLFFDRCHGFEVGALDIDASYFCISQRHVDRPMAEEFHENRQTHAGSEHLCGIRVAKTMWRRVLFELSSLLCLPEVVSES